MNMLVDYESESESSDVETIPLTTTATEKLKGHGPASVTSSASPFDSNHKHVQPDNQGGAAASGEDDFIMSALKDLQSFAASVEETSSSLAGNSPSIISAEPTTTTTTTTTAAPMDVDSSITLKNSPTIVKAQAMSEEQELLFKNFLQEIDAIPLTSEDQSQPPPPSSPYDSTHGEIPPPPPDPHETIETQWQTSQGVQSIYSRMHHLSFLPTQTVDQKDLERRLIEFAIRILDWEQGGLDPAYFLGKERAQAMESSIDNSGDEGEPEGHKGLPPPYGGIVGAMLKRMYELETAAVPAGWRAIWDSADEAYGFQHISTGMYSPVYPTLEQINYLDPPNATPLSSSTSTIASRRGKGTFSTSYTSSTSPITTGQQWKDAPCPQSVGSDKGSFPTTPVLSSPQSLQKSAPLADPESTPTKKKKRKAEDSSTGADQCNGDTHPFSDQHIHPSRRTVLTAKVTTVANASSNTNAPSKTMPKKMASLLQKWTEKDMEESDEDEEDHSEQELDEQAVSGANTQSLGGDWRERRLHRK